MIELTIKVDSVNYSDLAELLLPMLSDRLPKDGLVGRLMNSPERTEKLVKEILSRMSQDQKDELIGWIGQRTVKHIDIAAEELLCMNQDCAEERG